MGRVGVWARPGSRADSIVWDPWRKQWTVHCREPAREGRANAAILQLLADRLGVPRADVRYVRSGRSSSKVVEVEGLPTPQIEDRLRRATKDLGP